MAKGIQAGIENEPWHGENAEAFDGKRSLEQLVNRDLAGVSKALHQRIEQAIKSDEDPVLAYKIANLVGFYCTTLSRLLGSDSTLLEMLKACRESALRQYRSCTREVTNALASGNVTAPPDYDVPEFLSEALAALKDLLKSCDASYSGTESREESFQAILGESLDPFLAICENASAQIEEPGASILTINCHVAAKTILAPWDSTAERIASIDDRIDGCAAKLIDYQHAFFLQHSGVHPLLVALAPLTDSEEDLKSIRNLEPFQAELLAESSEILDDFLPSALMDATENLKRLKDTKMAGDITGEAALRFCEDFEHLESRIAAADNLEQSGSENALENGDDKIAPLRRVYPRTSGEIRVLIS